MGIYDILQEHNLSYKELTNIIHELAGCVFIDSTGIIRQLDQIYDDDEYRRDFPPAPARKNYTKGDCYCLCEILEHLLTYYKHAIYHSASYLGYDKEHGFQMILRLANDINDIICEEQDQRDYTEQMEDIMALKHLRTPDDE